MAEIHIDELKRQARESRCGSARFNIGHIEEILEKNILASMKQEINKNSGKISLYSGEELHDPCFNGKSAIQYLNDKYKNIQFTGDERGVVARWN